MWEELKKKKKKPDDFWSSCHDILVLSSSQLSEMDTNGHSHCQICQQGFSFCQQWQWCLDTIWGNCRHGYNFVSKACLSYATAESRKCLANSKWKKVRERVITLDIDVFSFALHSRSWALKSMHLRNPCSFFDCLDLTFNMFSLYCWLFTYNLI